MCASCTPGITYVLRRAEMLRIVGTVNRRYSFNFMVGVLLWSSICIATHGAAVLAWLEMVNIMSGRRRW